jgi:hypothetical protein
MQNGTIFLERRSLQAGWPDWASFRLLGDFLLWAVLWKLQKYIAQFIWLLFTRPLGWLFTLGSLLQTTYRSSPSYFATFTLKTLCINFETNGLGDILGDFLTNSSGHTGLRSSHWRVNTCSRFRSKLFAQIQFAASEVVNGGRYQEEPRLERPLHLFILLSLLIEVVAILP